MFEEVRETQNKWLGEIKEQPAKGGCARRESVSLLIDARHPEGWGVQSRPVMILSG